MVKKNQRNVFIILGVAVLIVVGAFFINTSDTSRDKVRELGDVCGPGHDGICKDGLICEQINVFPVVTEGICVVGTTPFNRKFSEACGSLYIGCCNPNLNLVCVDFSDQLGPNEGACVTLDTSDNRDIIGQPNCF